MKSLSLNLSSMKKIGGDKQHTLFMHKDGHQIRIAHKGLSALHKKQIESLPMAEDQEQEPIKMAKGGKVQHYDEGGMTSSDSTGNPDEAAQNAADQAEYAKTFEPTPPKVNNDPVFVDDSHDVENTPHGASGSWDSSPGNDSEDVQSGGQATSGDSSMATPQQVPQMNAGSAQPPIRTLDQKLQDNERDYQQKIDDMAKADKQYEDDLRNKKIDPNNYYSSQSTGKKLLHGLGLALSGMGSATTGQPNLAYQTINQAINNDIESQKNAQGQSMNLWKMHHSALQDNIQANLMARNNMLSDAKVKADEALGNLPGNMMSQRVRQLQDQMNYEQIMSRQKIGLLQQANSADKSVPGQNVNYNRMNALLQTGLMTPQEGQDATKEASELEESRALRQDYHKTFNELNDKFLAGALTPAARESAVWTLAGKLQHASAGRFNLEDAKKQMDGMLPSSFDLDETRKEKIRNGNNLFDVMDSKTPTLNRKGLKNNIQSSPQIKTVNGVRYMRGPNGEAIKVQ